MNDAVFDWHGQDARATGPLKHANTVTAQYGTGGGNTPIVIREAISRGSTQANAETGKNVATTLTVDKDRTIIAHKDERLAGNFCDRETDQNGNGIKSGKSVTLNTTDRHAVAYDARNSRIGGKVSGTLQAKENGEYSLNKINPLIETAPRYIVRRLMPIECGRLQGFPDGWGEIEKLRADMPDDTADFWREVYKTDCKIKGKKPQRAILESKDKLAAWHNKLHTDSAEYKMWGNGMALPNALFFIQRAVRLAAERHGGDSRSVRLGSMFDGSGTMPLCAAMCGARPIWASEVEPYPIAVTKTHLPEMEHVGSVLNLDGGKLKPADIITFGSPCQDLSTAGKRAGLDGNRSGLFRVAVRIIQEMLAATDGNYPQFVIWENVMGALSSNDGKDFEVVLNELRKLTGAVEPIRLHGRWGGLCRVRSCCLPICQCSILGSTPAPQKNIRLRRYLWSACRPGTF